MRLLPAFSARRLSWSRWLVLALMGLCMPLQGVLAVTMQISMATAEGTSGQASHSAAPVQQRLLLRAPAHGHGHGHGHHEHHGMPAHPDAVAASHWVAEAQTPDGHTPDAQMPDGQTPGERMAGMAAGLTVHDVAAHAGHATMHASADTEHLAQPVHSPGHAQDLPAEGSHDAQHDSHHGCSFCAQCCIGAALPVASLTVASALPATDHPVAGPAPILERLPQALDRPPKSFLA
ncbi:hypothetical protein SAMN05216359_11550 [Roseateles sp. YR242]|uniref:hypothetical protein n=1 Tax=Roseateles sp. YR242 TaxID=1855305 RepID=UPI0008B3F031|nr:hypothetical protein [Roseateles sp. YR242]SEL73646.1 hypothetical protein SAMN05216359_11550 [Roseateles sp. YR242]